MYYNATVDNSSAQLQYLTLSNDSFQSAAESGLTELNVGLASHRVYNVLYENVAYCLVAFLVPLTTLVFFNVRLVVELRRSRQLRRTLGQVQFSRRFSEDGRWSGGMGAGQQGGGATSAAGGGSNCQDERNITLVMVVIVVVFIVCELPASANQVSECSKNVCFEKLCF